MPGKPRASTQPEALFIELSNGLQGVKTAAMGIAGAIGQPG